MFSRLRNRFVIINMISTMTVVIIALAAIYLVQYGNAMSENKAKLAAYQPLTIASQSTAGEDNAPSAHISFSETFIPVGFTSSFQMLLDSRGEIVAIDSVFDISMETYEDIAASALADDDGSKVYDVDGTKWQYELSGVDTMAVIESTYGDGSVSFTQYGDVAGIVTCLDVTESYRSLNELLIILVATALGMGLLFFVVSLMSANRAIQPISAAWEGQKRFVADASHELKTPLAIINANMDAMLANPDNTIRQEGKWLTHSQEAADRMDRLISHMLELSTADNPDSGESVQLDLSEIVNNAVCSMEAVVYEKGVTLTSDIQPNVTAHGRQAMAEQLVFILLDNAAKYCEDGGSIDVTLKAGRHPSLAVGNSGKGIPPEDMPHLFDRFYRGDKSHSSHIAGYGLGLSLAKAIADGMGAAIKAESSGGHTVFSVDFPPAR